MKEEPIDYKQMKEKALEQLRSGKSLYGKDGAFAPLLKQFLKAALDGELEAHLDQEARLSGNRRNGRTNKQLKTSTGTLSIDTPRYLEASFEPALVRKRETILPESLESKILGPYGLGMSFRDISRYIKEMYDTDISHATLASITDKVIPAIREWQSRTLEELYCILWLDAMHYKEDSRVVSRAVYNVLGITREGHKELLGMYISESEGANFWLSVLTDLKKRGVKDVLISCIDNLRGFSEAITTIFPETEVQSCIVHQICNSLKYVASKDQKSFMQDLKPVYRAASKDLAELRLEELEKKWGQKYAVVTGSWRSNWEKLSVYFKYDDAIRKIDLYYQYHRRVPSPGTKGNQNQGCFSLGYSAAKAELPGSSANQ